MGNDPKNAVVNLAKFKKNKYPRSNKSIETSTQNESMIGYEMCNENKKENKDS